MSSNSRLHSDSRGKGERGREKEKKGVKKGTDLISKPGTE